jgi:hypothetical protein
MSDEIISALSAIALGIVGVAAIAVFVSRQANTSSVVGQAGSSFAQALLCAANPGGGNCGSSSSSTISFGNV